MLVIFKKCAYSKKCFGLFQTDFVFWPVVVGFNLFLCFFVLFFVTNMFGSVVLSRMPGVQSHGIKQAMDVSQSW